MLWPKIIVLLLALLACTSTEILDKTSLTTIDVNATIESKLDSAEATSEAKIKSVEVTSEAKIKSVEATSEAKIKSVEATSEAGKLSLESINDARISDVEEKSLEVSNSKPLPAATPLPEREEKETSMVVSPRSKGRPADKYACKINPDGFCVFTGNPHETGLKSSTNEIIDRQGNFLFYAEEAVAVNSLGKILEARGTPAFDGDDLVKGSQSGMNDDEKSFHKMMAIMFPIRNALMYDMHDLTLPEWEELVGELKKRNVKETTYTGGPTPRDNYYGRTGIFELAKNPNGKDIHHDVMKFLEESGLYLLCHVTSDEFNQKLKETHPEGHDPCQNAGISRKIPF